MISIRQINPVARAIVVIGAVMALVTSVTFAAMQSQVTLTDNTISTATAGLKLWDGAAFSATAPGVTVTGLVPGDWSEDYPVYFQNDGDAPLYLSASVPEQPELPAGMEDYGFSGWENLRVAVKGYCAPVEEVQSKKWKQDDNNGGGHQASHIVKTDMAALLAGEVDLPCGPLAEGAMGDSNTPGTAGNYSLSFKLKSEAVTGESAGVGAFDIVFSGSITE